MYEKEELDAVLFSVGPAAHPALTCEALDAGLHVWMEKPPAMRTMEIDKMISKRGDCIVVVGFKKAFMPSMRKAKNLLAESGSLRSMLVEYNTTIPTNGQNILDSRKVTDWLGNGCHPLSAMYDIGGKVKQVTSFISKHGGGSCILEFESGIVGTLVLAFGMRGPCERYSFYADQAHVVVENCMKVSMHRGIPFTYGKTVNYAPPGTDSGTIVWEPQNTFATLENKALFTQGMYDELQYFFDCILNGRKPETGSLEAAREIMKIYEAALLSNGRAVKIN